MFDLGLFVNMGCFVRNIQTYLNISTSCDSKLAWVRPALFEFRSWFQIASRVSKGNTRCRPVGRDPIVNVGTSHVAIQLLTSENHTSRYFTVPTGLQRVVINIYAVRDRLKTCLSVLRLSSDPKIQGEIFGN